MVLVEQSYPAIGLEREWLVNPLAKSQVIELE